MVFTLAKVLRAEEFLRANDLRAIAGGGAGGLQRGGQIGLRISAASVLKQAEGDGFWGVFHGRGWGAMVLKQAVKSSLCLKNRGNCEYLFGLNVVFPLRNGAPCPFTPRSSQRDNNAATT